MWVGRGVHRQNEGEERKGTSSPLHASLSGRPAIGEGCLDTCLDFISVHVVQAELGVCLEIWDVECDAGNDISNS